jgi:hypothetical protein
MAHCPGPRAPIVETLWRRDLAWQQSRVGSPPSLLRGYGETAFALNELRRLARLAVAHLRKVAGRKVSEGWRRERDSNPR